MNVQTTARGARSRSCVRGMRREAMYIGGGVLVLILIIILLFLIL